MSRGKLLTIEGTTKNIANKQNTKIKWSLWFCENDDWFDLLLVTFLLDSMSLNKV